MTRHFLTPLALLAFVSACATTPPAPAGDDAANPGHITGTVEAYNLGPGDLEATMLTETEEVVLGSGSVGARGDFTFAFSDDPEGAALRPLADLFATPNCTDWDISDRTARGVLVEHLSVVGARSKGTLVRATSRELLTNGPSVGDAVEGWFYVDREVNARGQCFDLSAQELDLKLEVGWNVVVTHYVNESSRRLTTGAPPTGLRWFAQGVPD